jgi:hypothetical protein
MATVKEGAYQIALSFDRGSDYIFIERCKQLIIAVSNTFLHREIDKYGLNETFVNDYIATLMIVDKSVDPNLPIDSTILRTTNKIPRPIRFQSDVPFPFVGSVDRAIPYRHIKPYAMEYVRNLKYIGNSICYFYVNEYIYIYNNTKVESVLISGTYEDVSKLTGTDATGICYLDNMELPVGQDMYAAILAEVARLLRMGNDATDKIPTTDRDLV